MKHFAKFIKCDIISANMQINLVRFSVSILLAFLLFGAQIGEAYAYLTPGEAFGLPAQGVDNGSPPQEDVAPLIPTLVPQEDTNTPQVPSVIPVPSVASQITVPRQAVQSVPTEAPPLVHGASPNVMQDAASGEQRMSALPTSGMATTNVILISILSSIVFFYSRRFFYS